MPSKNLVTDFGAVSDAQRQTANVTISSGTKNLLVGSALFASGDVGKAITIWNGGFTNGSFTSKIDTFVSSTSVTLHDNAPAGITTSSSDLLWGTDNIGAFTGTGNWRDWARTQTNPILIIPDGNYAVSSSAAAGQGLSDGVVNATWQGQSGSAANCVLYQLSSPSEFRPGGDSGIAPVGLTQTGANNARLQTASIGASSVALVDKTTYGSRVAANRWCLIAAYDTQGLNNSFFGYPPNSYFFEWNYITAYNSGTGVITLLNPLTNTYKSTYPLWGSDTIFGADQGGPATIWIMPATFDSTFEMDDITIDSPHNQGSVQGNVNVILRRCVMNGPGIYPTQCKTFLADTCTYPQVLEVDKMVDQATFSNCPLHILQQQSASPNRCFVSGGTIQQLEMAKFTQADNVTFTGAARIIVGVSAYGACSRAVLNNCSGIATIDRGGGSLNDLDGGTTHTNASDWFTFSGGILSFLKSKNDSAGGTGQQNPTRLFAPGTWISFDDKYIDQIADVYEDGTSCFITFVKTTNWPFTPVVVLGAHPCPDFTMNACTGTAPELEDWNQAPKRIPFLSYSKRTYTNDGSGATAKAKPTLLGNLATWKATVSVTGSGTFHESQFDNWTTYKPDFSTYTFAPAVNCANASPALRTVTGGTTASGGQSGDTLPDLTSIGRPWFAGPSNSGPVFSSAGSGAIISAEFVMDQGIPAGVPSAVVPLRLRLHS